MKKKNSEFSIGYMLMNIYWFRTLHIVQVKHMAVKMMDLFTFDHWKHEQILMLLHAFWYKSSYTKDI